MVISYFIQMSSNSTILNLYFLTTYIFILYLFKLIFYIIEIIPIFSILFISISFP